MTRLGLVFCVWAAGCTASAEDVSPPDRTLFFPTGLAVSPDGNQLFVTNANSELRYDSGAVSVIDLEKVDQIVANWTATQALPADDPSIADFKDDDGRPDCYQDSDHTETLICEEALFIAGGVSAKIGNFATSVGVQDLNDGRLRMIIPTRGDPSIAWVDYANGKLSCNENNKSFELCDDNHRLSYIHNDPNLAYLPEEPFDVSVDSAGGFAMVTHLTTGDVTLVNSPADGNATIADVAVGIFAASQLSGLRGSTGVATRSSSHGDIVYVGSRTEDRIQTFTVGRPVNTSNPFLVPGNYFFLDAVGGNAGGSSDTRGMGFSTDANRMYLINRNPPSLQVYDTSLKDTGFPVNEGIGATDICRQASTLASMDTGDGERIYITCFSDGQLYIVDPRGQTTVDDILTVGRGPFAVAAAPSRKKVYVTNFLEDTVSVIDVAAGSPTRNRVVLRIGKVKPL
ncbi:MAG: YncE family protein [Kofleriaceae bacterium]